MQASSDTDEPKKEKFDRDHENLQYMEKLILGRKDEDRLRPVFGTPNLGTMNGAEAVSDSDLRKKEADRSTIASIEVEKCRE